MQTSPVLILSYLVSKLLSSISNPTKLHNFIPDSVEPLTVEISLGFTFNFGFSVVANLDDDNLVDSVDDVDEVKSFSGNFVVLEVNTGFGVVVVAREVVLVVLGIVCVVFGFVCCVVNSMRFSVELTKVLMFVTLFSSTVSFNRTFFGVVTMSLIDEPILSAFASIISKPARMKSKKLFSVVGRALKGGNVDDSVTITFSVFSSSGGSSEPKRSEKKSMESVSASSSGSSSSCC